MSADELVALLKENKVSKVEIRTDNGSVEDYTRIGKLIFAISRAGIDPKFKAGAVVK